MKCRDCKWMYTNETMNGLYICVNGNSEAFSCYTGYAAEEDCPDCESDMDIEDDE